MVGRVCGRRRMESELDNIRRQKVGTSQLTLSRDSSRPLGGGVSSGSSSTGRCLLGIVRRGIVKIDLQRVRCGVGIHNDHGEDKQSRGSRWRMISVIDNSEGYALYILS